MVDAEGGVEEAFLLWLIRGLRRAGWGDSKLSGSGSVTGEAEEETMVRRETTCWLRARSWKARGVSRVRSGVDGDMAERMGRELIVAVVYEVMLT